MIVFGKKNSKRLRAMFKKKEFKRIFKKQCFPRSKLNLQKKNHLLFTDFPQIFFWNKRTKSICIIFRVKTKDLRFIKEMKCQIIEAVEKRKTSEETLL